MVAEKNIMTDAEKLKAIFDYAKRSYDNALLERNMVEASYYEKDEEEYNFEMVCYTHQMVSERSAFFHTVKQIIEKPDEYLKEKAFIEEFVKRIEATKEKIKHD